MRRVALLVLACASAVLVAACGGGDGPGRATVWVTTDRGREVVLTARVPAGLTALQALDRVAEVKTRYGGRFVQAVEGIEGSLARKRDWFYFVNGIEADRGAAEYRVRPGDVIWWDYRSWAERMRQPVVVGAFPEPFLHGYGGRVRPAAVRYETVRMRGVALALAALIDAESVEPIGVPVAGEANLLLVVSEPVPFSAGLRREGAPAGSPVLFRISAGDAERLVKDPDLARYRYEGLEE